MEEKVSVSLKTRAALLENRWNVMSFLLLGDAEVETELKSDKWRNRREENSEFYFYLGGNEIENFIFGERSMFQSRIRTNDI